MNEQPRLQPPVHTPYDGSARPFAIGLKPLDLDDWIEADHQLEAYLAEKDRLFATQPDRVFGELPETRAAQAEVLGLLTDHLPRRFPALYRRHGVRMAIGSGDRTIDLSDEECAPLKLASFLVQEDLVLMRRDENGWRLAAAALCFPSSWSLQEKFGRPLQDIHNPVPHYGPGTRTADVITRIFDNLRPEQPVWRMNWSLQTDAELYKPMSSEERNDRAAARPSRFPAESGLDSLFIRVERQTLRRLSHSGDILFTIRIHLDPVAALNDHPQRNALAISFAAQLESLDPAQLDYKGLAADRDHLAASLRALAAQWISGCRALYRKREL